MDLILLLKNYWWVIAIVLLGACVNLLRELVEAQADPDSAVTLLAGVYMVLGSIFSGISLGLVSTYFLESELVVAGLSALASGAGPKGLAAMVDIGLDYAKAKFGIKDDKPVVNVNVDTDRNQSIDEIPPDDWEQGS